LGTGILLAVFFRATLLDYFPLVSDELAYSRQIAAFVRAGFNAGYFTNDERAAPFTFSHFSVHGPAFPMIYGIVGRLVGWSLQSGPLFNLCALALATVIFIAVARLDRRQIALTGIVITSSWWVLLMLTITMQETLNQAFMIVMAAFAARLLTEPEQRSRVRLLAISLAVLVTASVLRPTNWVVAPPLVLIALGDRRWFAFLGTVAATVGIGVFWLLWRYLSAPIAGLHIDLGEIESAGSVWSYFKEHFSDNMADVFALRPFVEHPFFQHVMFEGAAITAISAVLIAVALMRPTLGAGGVGRRSADSLSFRVDLFNAATAGLALVAFLGFYFDSEASISRVMAPFVLLTLLAMVATRCRTAIVATVIVANALVAPSFLQTYRGWRVDEFTYDRRPFERFRSQISPIITFEDGKNAWCNTLLTTTYPREIAAVPAGIGLSISTDANEIAGPVKSRYLLLTSSVADSYSAKARLKHLQTTDLGELVLNLDAPCE
jgi:hypothetical protein